MIKTVLVIVLSVTFFKLYFFYTLKDVRKTVELLFIKK